MKTEEVIGAFFDWEEKQPGVITNCEAFQAGAAYAATLRQQAGRVDEDARDAVAKAIADVIGHGMREKCYAHADAVLAALAQNTQGEAVAGYITADNLALLKQDDGSAFGHMTAPIYSRARSDREIPLYLHAERARVPADKVLVPREPTAEMLKAGFLTGSDSFELDQPADAPGLVYKAMLSAAPSQRAEVKS